MEKVKVGVRIDRLIVQKSITYVCYDLVIVDVIASHRLVVVEELGCNLQ